MELTSFSGRWKVVLVLGYLALVAGVSALGEVTGWWAWDDGWVLPAVAVPYWLLVLGVDAGRGGRSGQGHRAEDDRTGDGGSPVTADEVLHAQLATTRLRSAPAGGRSPRGTVLRRRARRPIGVPWS